jgi:hypothetical protein
VREQRPFHGGEQRAIDPARLAGEQIVTSAASAGGGAAARFAGFASIRWLRTAAQYSL